MCKWIHVKTTHRITATTNVFLKNYIYIILLFYREPYQKYKILTKKSAAIYKNIIYLLQIIRKGLHTKNIFIDIYSSAQKAPGG